MRSLCIGGPLNAGSVRTTDLACYCGSCIGVCAQSCGDNQCDGTEICGGQNSGLECNADCGKCANGSFCRTNADCSSGRCEALTCRACKSSGLRDESSDCCDGSCNITISGPRC